MNIVDAVEHADGSATMTFEMSEKEKTELLQLGIYTALKRGIEAEKSEFDFTQMGETQ